MTLLQLLAAVVLGLMCGSKLNVGVFAHPTLNRQAFAVHIPVRASFASLFGHIMPFWMGGSTLLNIALLLPFEHLTASAWRLTAIACGLQILCVIFSLVAPVPINNQIMKWTPQALPENWHTLEGRWDLYHAARTTALIAAFVILVLSTSAR